MTDSDPGPTALAREALQDAFAIVTLTLDSSDSELLVDAILDLKSPHLTVQTMAAILREYIEFLAKACGVTPAEYWSAQATEWAGRHG